MTDKLSIRSFGSRAIEHAQWRWHTLFAIFWSTLNTGDDLGDK
jgi:hypothetical protein